MTDHGQEVALGSFHPFPFADVLGDGRRTDDASRRVGDRRHAHGDIDPPAVFRHANRIMVADSLPTAQAVHEVPKLVNPLGRKMRAIDCPIISSAV